MRLKCWDGPMGVQSREPAQCIPTAAPTKWHLHCVGTDSPGTAGLPKMQPTPTPAFSGTPVGMLQVSWDNSQGVWSRKSAAQGRVPAARADASPGCTKVLLETPQQLGGEGGCCLLNTMVNNLCLTLEFTAIRSAEERKVFALWH